MSENEQNKTRTRPETTDNPPTTADKQQPPEPETERQQSDNNAPPPAPPDGRIAAVIKEREHYKNQLETMQQERKEIAEKQIKELQEEVRKRDELISELSQNDEWVW